jgi:hypothetical protein
MFFYSTAKNGPHFLHVKNMKNCVMIKIETLLTNLRKLCPLFISLLVWVSKWLYKKLTSVCSQTGVSILMTGHWAIESTVYSLDDKAHSEWSRTREG